LYRHDGLLPVMSRAWAAAKRADPAQPRIILHRQSPQDLSHQEYRQVCYDAPQVAERVAVLALYEGRRWLSVHLYRGWEHGPFDPVGMRVIEAFAPLIVHAVRLHHTGQVLHGDVSDALLARLLRRCPQLTQRDQDVLRSQMAGHSTEVMAARLGLTHQSALTYHKRVYRKLGISGQRELLGLLLEPSPPLSPWERE
jgi:DNA-binding CsgD family transcriptional regulator